MRDFALEPTARTHRRCGVCAADYVFDEAELASWEAEHEHEGEA